MNKEELTNEFENLISQIQQCKKMLQQCEVTATGNYMNMLVARDNITADWETGIPEPYALVIALVSGTNGNEVHDDYPMLAYVTEDGKWDFLQPLYSNNNLTVSIWMYIKQPPEEYGNFEKERYIHFFNTQSVPQVRKRENDLRNIEKEQRGEEMEI